MHQIKISKRKVINVINRKEKNRQLLFIHVKKTISEYLKKVCTVSNLSKEKMLVTSENVYRHRNQLQSL